MSTQEQIPQRGQGDQQSSATLRRAWTRPQKLALEDLFKQHAELRFHGGAEGLLAKLQNSHADHFHDETAQRVGNWFKTRRKVLNRQRRAAEDAAEGRTYREEDPAETLSPSHVHAASDQQVLGGNNAQDNHHSAGTPCNQESLHDSAAREIDPELPEISDREPGRYKKYTSEYKSRQSLCKQIDKYCRKARGKTEVALCISSSTQKETIWVHGRGMAMNSAARREVIGKTFKELINKKREDVENGILSEGEETGGGGVRQGNYSHSVPAYLSFFKSSQRHVRDSLSARGLTASQHFTSQLTSKIWQILTPEDRSLIHAGTSLREVLTCHPSIWDEAYRNVIEAADIQRAQLDASTDPREAAIPAQPDLPEPARTSRQAADAPAGGRAVAVARALQRVLPPHRGNTGGVNGLAGQPGQLRQGPSSEYLEATIRESGSPTGAESQSDHDDSDNIDDHDGVDFEGLAATQPTQPGFEEQAQIVPTNNYLQTEPTTQGQATEPGTSAEPSLGLAGSCLTNIQSRTPGVRDSWLGQQAQTRTRPVQIQQAAPTMNTGRDTGCEAAEPASNPETNAGASCPSEGSTRENSSPSQAAEPSFIPYGKNLELNLSGRALRESLLYHRDADGNEICTHLHGHDYTALRAWLQQFRDATGPLSRKGYKVMVHNDNLKRTIYREYKKYELRSQIHDSDGVNREPSLASDLLQRIKRLQDEETSRRAVARCTRPDYRRLAGGR